MRAGDDVVYGTRCGIPSHGGAKQKRLLLARLQRMRMDRSIQRIGTPIAIDPGDALLQQLYVWQGNFAVLQEQVRRLMTPIAVDPTRQTPELFDLRIQSSIEMARMGDQVDFAVQQQDDAIEIDFTAFQQALANNGTRVEQLVDDEEEETAVVVSVEDEPEVEPEAAPVPRRPKGIANLASAGAPQRFGGLSMEALDLIGQKDPDRLGKLYEKIPGLYDFHLGKTT